MNHDMHAGHHAHDHHGQAGHGTRAGATPSLDRIAFLATLHCLSGCAVGEVAGMVLGTALGLSNGETIALAVMLAFVSGYAFTMIPLLKAGYGLREASRLALMACAKPATKRACTGRMAKKEKSPNSVRGPASGKRAR